MNTFTKALAGAALVLSVSFSIAQAATLTNDQVNAILNLLQSFGADQTIISNVQASLTGGTPSVSNSGQGDDRGEQGDSHRGMPPAWMGSTTPPMMGSTTSWGNQGTNGQHEGMKACLTFVRNLSQGAQGDDVKNLQQMLADEGEFNGTTTGFFGAMTARALAMWQEHQGIASSTNGGALGPATRGFLERRCGAGQGDNGRGNGGVPGMGGMMGSTSTNMPMRPAQQ